MLNPAVNRWVFHIYNTLGQHLLQFKVADALFAVPAYRLQDNVTLIMPTFDRIKVLLRQQRVVVSLSPQDSCNKVIDQAGRVLQHVLPLILSVEWSNHARREGVHPLIRVGRRVLILGFQARTPKIFNSPLSINLTWRKMMLTGIFYCFRRLNVSIPSG